MGEEALDHLVRLEFQMRKRIRVNKVFYDRRAREKPQWLCTIQGGIGANMVNIVGKGAGCCRLFAWIKAKRQWRKARREARR